MKRKIKLLLILAFSLVFLAGWGKKTVELLNDKKLIDLNAALGNCMLGADDLTPEEGSTAQTPQSTVTPAPTVQPTVTPTPVATPKPTPPTTPKPKPRSVVISVRGREVTCGSTQWDDMDALKERIIREANSNVTFRLVDDYAEAHVYRQILAILEELEAEMGISYLRD